MFVVFFITSGLVYSPLMESPRFQKDTAVPDPHFSSHFTQLLTPDVHTEAYSPLMESPRFQKDTAVPDPHFSSHFTQLLTPDVHTE